MDSLKKGQGVPLLNFEGGLGVTLLNFRGVPRSWVSGSWPHFYTMPIIRTVVCVRTDNNLITFFIINQSCTRNLQSILYAAYMFLLFSIASVKLKQIQFVICFAFFSLLSFLSFLSSPLDYRILIVIHSCVLLFSCCLLVVVSYPKKLHHSLF